MRQGVEFSGKSVKTGWASSVGNIMGTVDPALGHEEGLDITLKKPF